MKLPIALGIAAAALTVAAASAQSISRHVVIHGDSDSVSRIDANEDGWVTRAEASSAYERIFGELDTNNDGRLDNADRRNIRVHVDAPNVGVFRSGPGDEEVRVITGDLDPETEARIEREIEEAMERAEIHIERAERDAERAEREAERAAERAERLAERAAERAERDAERAERHAERHVQRFRDGDRNVVIIRSGDGEGGSWTSLEGAVAQEALLVPQVAITRDAKGNALVFVVGDDGKVTQRALQATQAVGDEWIVDSGLQAGERVVVEGMQKLRMGMAVKVVSAADSAASAAR